MNRIEYKVVSSFDYSKFRTDIEDMLNNGWSLQGGVSTNFSNAGAIYYSQALTIVRKTHDS